MPVMDEFREEREALKHGTPKEKWDYFWDYYKWHVIIGAVILVVVTTIIVQMVNRKDTAFYIALINGIELVTAEEHIQGFAEYAGIDMEEYNVFFDTSIRINTEKNNAETSASREKLMVYLVAQGLDICVFDEPTLEQYIYNDTFMDLRELLTQEQLTEYASRFYYIDQAVLDAKNAAMDAMDFSFEAEFPDSRHPEAMGNPVPVGIYLETDNPLRECYYYADDTPVILTVPISTAREEMAVQYINFVLQ